MEHLMLNYRGNPSRDAHNARDISIILWETLILRKYMDDIKIPKSIE